MYIFIRKSKVVRTIILATIIFSIFIIPFAQQTRLPLSNKQAINSETSAQTISNSIKTDANDYGFENQFPDKLQTSVQVAHTHNNVIKPFKEFENKFTNETQRSSTTVNNSVDDTGFSQTILASVSNEWLEHFLSEKPFVVIGSLSEAKNEGKELAQSLGLESYYDVTLLSEKRYLILVGENYTNLFTLLFEQTGKTPINIDDNYPGKGIGVIYNFDAYDAYSALEKHIIVISGSDADGTKNAIEYFQNAAKEGKSLEQGITFINANLQQIEVDIKTVTLDQSVLNRYFFKFYSLLKAETDNMHSKYTALKNAVMEKEGKVKDFDTNIYNYISAFLRFDHDHLPTFLLGIFNSLSNATDKDLCKVTLLTYEGGVLEPDSPYTKFIKNKMRHTSNMFHDNHPWNSKNKHTWRKESAEEMYLFDKYFGKVTGDCYAQAMFNEAVFRLWGLPGNETFMLSIGYGGGGGHSINFLKSPIQNRWFLFDSTHHISPIVYSNYNDKYKLLRGFFSESAYTVFSPYDNEYHSKSNMEEITIAKLANIAKSLFANKDMEFGSYKNHKKNPEDFAPFTKFKDVVDIPMEATVKDAMPELPNEIPELSYNPSTDYAYLLKTQREKLTDESTNYLSLIVYDEILSKSIKYPVSQYNISRYAMQTMRVKHPEVYAAGALYAVRTKEDATEFSKQNSIDNVIEFVQLKLSDIKTLKNFSEHIQYPDMTRFIKHGTPQSKALYAYALAYHLLPHSERKNLYVLLGYYSGYLEYKENGKEFYLDCSNQKILENAPTDVWVKINENSHTFFNLPPIIINTSNDNQITIWDNKLHTFKFTVFDPNWETSEKTVSTNTDKIGISSTRFSDHFKEIIVTIDPAKFSDGTYNIPITVSDKYGNSNTNIKFKIEKDEIPPQISLTNPEESMLYTNLTEITIQGLVSDNISVKELYINGYEVGFSNNGKFSYTIPLSPEQNKINIEAIDEAGNKTNTLLTIISDNVPPELVVTSPQDMSIVNEDEITVEGTVTDNESGVESLTIDGNNVTVNSDGSFSTSVSLTEGDNTITIVATDKAGNKTTKTVLVTYKPQIVITLQPDNPYMTVNGIQQEIDPGRGTKPVIIAKWGRTVVPIRAIVEALGGTIGWDGKERKVTINFNDTVIELWIDNPKAKVNGETKWIDPNNHDVKPIIVNSRTMLPLRFVAESLGCTVNWDATTRTITIIYGG